MTADDRLARRNTFTLQDTHIISPAMINTARVGLNRTYYNDEKVTLNGDFTPGTDRIDPGFAPPRRDEGPAMYWYGWIANSALGASVLGTLACWLPQKIRACIAPALSWFVPIALLPVLIYSLKFYWRW